MLMSASSSSLVPQRTARGMGRASPDLCQGRGLQILSGRAEPYLDTDKVLMMLNLSARSVFFLCSLLPQS